MGFLDIANGNLIFMLVSLGILMIITQSILFMYGAIKHAKELGIDTSTIFNIVKSSAIFTIVPSISIVLGLAALAPSIGIPWSWFRLSVIGSVSYELMAANMASTSLGYETLSQAVESGPEAFGAIMFAMSTGVAGGMVLDFFLISKVNTTMIRFKEKSGEFGPIALSVLFYAVLVVFVVPIFGSGIVPLLTFLTSILAVLTQGFLIKRFKMIWLKNFVLSFALIVGMGSSVLWTNIFL